MDRRELAGVLRDPGLRSRERLLLRLGLVGHDGDAALRIPVRPEPPLTYAVRSDALQSIIHRDEEYMTGKGAESGDTKKLAALIAKLTRVGRGDFARGLVVASGDVARKQIEGEFSSGRDPAGNAWPRPVGGGSPLVASGRLRGSIVVSQSADGISVHAGAPYARIHQRGGIVRAKKARFLRFRLPNGKFVSKALVQIPKRSFLPEGSLAGPWRDALTAAAALLVKKFL